MSQEARLPFSQPSPVTMATSLVLASIQISCGFAVCICKLFGQGLVHTTWERLTIRHRGLAYTDTSYSRVHLDLLAAFLFIVTGGLLMLMGFSERWQNKLMVIAASSLCTALSVIGSILFIITTSWVGAPADGYPIKAISAVMLGTSLISCYFVCLYSSNFTCYQTSREDIILPRYNHSTERNHHSVGLAHPREERLHHHGERCRCPAGREVGQPVNLPSRRRDTEEIHVDLGALSNPSYQTTGPPPSYRQATALAPLHTMEKPKLSAKIPKKHLTV